MKTIHFLAFVLALCLVNFVSCRSVRKPISFTLEDLHLEEVDENTVITTKWLVKRATDAIIFRENDDDVKDASWEFNYETDSHDHHQRGMIVDNELSIVGGYSVRNTGGYTTTTMYIADKNGFRPMISVRFDPNLLKSAVG